MNFDLQLFGERNLSKIDNPAKYCVDWNSYDAGQREGLIEHWQHEISNFEESIQNRIDELEKRGEKYE